MDEYKLKVNGVDLTFQMTEEHAKKVGAELIRRRLGMDEEPEVEAETEPEVEETEEPKGREVPNKARRTSNKKG